MKKIFLFASLIPALVSCKKVVNVNLETAASQIVIEGKVSNDKGAMVSISRSVPYTNSNRFPLVAGADVKITDDMGITYVLTPTTEGVYANEHMVGVPGRTYRLIITAEGKEYTAVSTMPQPVVLDGLLQEQMNLGTKDYKIIKLRFTDPAEVGNYYKFTKKINGKTYPYSWIWDDKMINNGVNMIPLVQIDSVLKQNDVVEVEMQCVDRNIYRYFNALHDLKMNSSTPANPANNITGGALGYFSAHTSETKSITIR